ncbi:hypothetical protein LTR85_010708 [Meristemomyces frigidus]|nr:hypothetical protein LTR85_010708 [Meristemomyces frigidus]
MAPSYGTTSAEQSNGNGLLDAGDQERAALLGESDGKDRSLSRVRNHMTEDISKSWGDVALLVCYIITGLLDSSSVQAWGSFASMQTGNTVYLGLGLVAPGESTRWIRAIISIACFCLGSAFFSRYHNYLGPRRRWVMVSSYIIQLLCMIAAALMVTLGPEDGASGPVSEWIAIPIALIAFQAGGQAYTSRVLQYGGLTSVVLTSVYCDLFSDQRLFSGITENVERNRRSAAPLLLLGGAMLGGLWAHSDFGLAGAIWTAVVLKGFVTLAWALWAAAPEDD